MKISISTYRSAEWLAAQTLARGENLSDAVVSEIEPANLSLASRAAILDFAGGKYPSQFVSLNYGETGQLKIDSDAPSPAEIDAAITAAQERMERESNERAEQEAVEKAERQRKDAERQRKDAAMAQARELLASDLARLEAAVKEVEAQRDELARFAAEVPSDAQRGVVKALAEEDGGATAAAIQQRIEDASPRYRIFDEE